MSGHGVSLFIILICVLGSAYFSATETAFNSLNRVRIKNMAEKGNKRAARVLQLLKNYDKLLSTILIGNNAVNIGATSLATVIFVQMLGKDLGSGVSTLVTTLVLLIFGEISPKSMAFEFSESFAMASAPLISICMVILSPLTWLFGRWKHLLAHLIKGSEDHSITEEELLTIVDEAEDEGGIGEQESTLIRNSIEFIDQEAQEILTPRVDIEGVELVDTTAEIARVFEETGYSRLPVFEEDLDHIVGVLNQKDFYSKVIAKKIPIGEIVRPILFITPHTRIGELLAEFQQKKMHMAIVLDEYGGTTGLVTMEDILEELVGEIWDEHDQIIQEIKEVGQDEYLVMGTANLDRLMEILDIEDDFDPVTVSGWLFDLAGRVPSEGELFEDHGLELTVLQMDGNRVEQVRVVRLPGEEESEE